MFQNKKILIGITGSIAAYKIITLVRLLTKAGAAVKVIATPNAVNFVSPIVLSTLTQHKVLYQLTSEDEWANHVMLGRWADVFLIAPLSCNTLAKMANGICDNLLLATYLSATCKVIAAPAMDEDMWKHASTKRNINLLRKDGVEVLGVNTGSLASGLEGEGRMQEPEELYYVLAKTICRTNELQNKKVLVTAGPTYEHIDPVRFIGNHSSGKMGYAIAEAFYLRGADVTLISGPVNIHPNFSDINVVSVTTAKEMYEASIQHFKKNNIAVLSAAVADFTPLKTEQQKIKKTGKNLTIALQQTTDILAALGNAKKKNQFLVGFALETHNEMENAYKKLISKKADAIVLNSLNNKAVGFGKDTNCITIIANNNFVQTYQPKTKQAVANDIVSFVLSKYHA